MNNPQSRAGQIGAEYSDYTHTANYLLSSGGTLCRSTASRLCVVITTVQYNLDSVQLFPLDTTAAVALVFATAPVGPGKFLNDRMSLINLWMHVKTSFHNPYRFSIHTYIHTYILG